MGETKSNLFVCSEQELGSCRKHRQKKKRDQSLSLGHQGGASFGKFEKARKGLVWRFEDFLEMVFMSDIFFAAEEKVEEGAWEKER